MPRFLYSPSPVAILGFSVLEVSLHVGLPVSNQAADVKESRSFSACAPDAQCVRFYSECIGNFKRGEQSFHRFPVTEESPHRTRVCIRPGGRSANLCEWGIGKKFTGEPISTRYRNDRASNTKVVQAKTV